MSVGNAGFATWQGALSFAGIVAASGVGRQVAGFRFTGMPFTVRSDGLPSPTSFTYTDQVITSFTMSFEIGVGATVTAPTTLSLYVVYQRGQVNPPVFSATQMPIDILAAGNALEVARTPLTSANLMDTPYSFTAPDPSNVSAVNAGVAARGLANVNAAFRRQGTQGAMAFLVDFTDPSVGVGNTVALATIEDGVRADPLFITEELTDITGIEGHVDAWSRISRCPRCVKPMPRQMFVEDGFKRGLLVCQKCYDPPDFHGEWGRRLVGTEREGIHD
jgi:hypothetical protein